VLDIKEQQISALDKDNFYYKQANRELKRRLRDLLTTTEGEEGGEGGKGAGERASSARESELMKLNRSLREEMTNYKQFMRRTGTAVRVSKRGVREATPSVSGVNTQVAVIRQRPSSASVDQSFDAAVPMMGSVNFPSTSPSNDWAAIGRQPFVERPVSVGQRPRSATPMEDSLEKLFDH
jgi:hypothetical protein